MRPLCLLGTVLVVGLASADPPKPTKADLEKKLKEAKEALDKAVKGMESFKADKEIGTLVAKHMAAREKFLEARAKQFELQALPNYSAAVEQQDNAWGKTAISRDKEAGQAREAIEKKASKEKWNQYFEAYGKYDESLIALQGVKIQLIQLKAGK